MTPSGTQLGIDVRGPRALNFGDIYQDAFSISHTVVFHTRLRFLGIPPNIFLDYRSELSHFLHPEISCLFNVQKTRQIKFSCQSNLTYIFYTNLAKYFTFHGPTEILRNASSINKQISNILHSFLFRCRMSMNDKMILSSDFTGYIKRFSGNWLS